MITNWFSVAAGVCFACAAVYGQFFVGQPLKIVIMYGFLCGVNFILGTL